jgi:hypothetical protein
MRRVAIALAALFAAFVVASPVAAASATSWRATIVGAHLHGGATTLIGSNGTGSINVTLSGVTPGDVVTVLVNPLACPEEAQQIFGFDLPAASSAGVAAGRLTLTARQVAAYDAALTRREPISILVVSQDDKGCGDQVGAPSVATARLQGTVAPVGATYDIRYPVIRGIAAGAAIDINDQLRADANASIAAFTTDATNEGPPPNGSGTSVATQTFSVSLSQPTLLSLGELYSEFLAGAAHPLAALSTDTFDLRTGAQIHLADLFRPGSAWLGVLSMQSRARLRTLFHDPSLDGTIDQGTAASAGNFAGWQLLPTGLRITFSEYQVGPYAIGMPSIVIPWASLRSVLNLSSPVAALTPAGPCLASQLRAQMSDWEGGVGSRFDRVVLTNRSAAPCFLQGTPRTQLIDATGRVLLDSAAAGPSGAAHVGPHDPRVVIAAGAAARIDVITNNYCGPTPAQPVRLALTLPGAGGRVVGAVGPSGGFVDDVPPCFGPTAPGAILTNGWHHA